MPLAKVTDISVPSGTYYSGQTVPVTVTLDQYAIATENAKLMPIEDVLAIAKQYFSAQYYDDLVISDMKLSYTRVDKQNDKGHYYYVPVWDFYGKTSMIDPGKDLEIYSFLTINALDGTIIDRTYGY